MKVAVLTLGCKTNQAESEKIISAVLGGGHSLVSLKDSPDLCIINTCTVTAKTDCQARQLVRRALKTGAEIVVTGCYSELRGREVKALSPRLKIIPNNEKSRIVSMLGAQSETPPLTPGRGRARPLVKIQDGCNYSCSYCAIPMARGRSRSRSMEEITAEVRSLEEAGFGEIVLTGIHIGHYGHDLEPKATLSILVENILKKTYKCRLRLSSVEANEIDVRLLELLGDRRLCPHLHIPLQSGDDTILRSMNRPYSRRYYIDRVREVHDLFPGLAIGTDIIVGFPGEGESEFENTVRLVEELPFAYLHVFPYSDRPGTASESMAGHVHPGVRKRRAAVLRRIGEEKRDAYRRSQAGRTLEVVCEGRAGNGLYKGKSDNYINVYLDNSSCQPGMPVSVVICEVFQDGLRGVPLREGVTP